jgi:hypothetical protein
MSFKNDYSILLYLGRQMAVSPFAYGQARSPVVGQQRGAVISFSLTDCAAPGVKGTWQNEARGWETNYASLHG